MGAKPVVLVLPERRQAMKQHRDIFSIIHYGTNEEYFEVIADADFYILKHGHNLLQESIACNKPNIAADLIKRDCPNLLDSLSLIDGRISF